MNGLTQAEALRLLEQHGPNDIRPRKRMLWLRRLIGVLSEPTLLVLVLVLIFYLALGSIGEASMLAVFVVIVIAVTYFEEARTENAVAALSAFASPRAVALRDGEWKRIPGIDVVPGDFLKLSEGDRVSADAELSEAHDFRVDESLLTGESQGVWKNDQVGATSAERQVWAGSLILQGQGLARVTATGLKTKVGQISSSLSEIKAEATPFQKSASRLVRMLAIVAAVACTAVVLLSMMDGASFMQAILKGLTLAIATVPEELPVILAVFLALGARRLSKHGVLATKVPAVETLGAITLLAVDKTGTLTKNEMHLQKVVSLGGADEAALLMAAADACEIEPFDPMERQILLRAGAPLGRLSHEYALGGRPPRMGHIWNTTRVGAKGAVEGVLEHCEISDSARSEALLQSKELASQGFRVLGVAGGSISGDPPPELPKGLRFLGLLAFEDPLREGVKDSIALARKAGMRVVMMTGDSAETAGAIARQLGFHSERVVLGDELEKHPETVEALAREIDVFARLAPEQKLILVQAWSRLGEVVGMTGDGVNDAPALIQAHVGIGLGERGTDVAREAADLVLTDDSFGSLIEGIRIGRGTTRRILRAALFVLAVHVPIIGIVLACIILKMPPLIEAAQIAFLELFIGPTCSVVFEKALDDSDLMLLPPRDPRAPMLSWKASASALFQGFVIFAVVLWIYRGRLASGMPAPEARATAFFTLMIADLLLCWTLLSAEPFWKKERFSNMAFWGVSAGVMLMLTGLMAIPLTSSLFHMGLLTGPELLGCLGAASAAVLWFELPKITRHAL